MKKSHRLILISAITVFILAAAIVAVLLLVFRNPSNLPEDISNNANFSVYYPEEDEAAQWQVDASTLTFDKESQLLTYTLTTSGNKVVITEQPTPDVFADVPQYYAKLLDKLHQYAEVNTAVGTVTLTRPDELKGGQSAVVNTGKGTLMFAHPDRELNESEWKAFFNSLRVVK